MYSLKIFWALAIGIAAVLSSLEATAKTDLTHLLRIQISVEFDGERIDFDETIVCGSGRISTLTSGYSTQVLPSRLRISYPTREGGLLSFPVSWILCRAGAEVWWPGVDAERAWKPPQAYLPPFRWADAIKIASRRRGEIYISETYLNNPNARLKILTPMRFSIPEHPPSRAAIRAAREREERDNALWEFEPGTPKHLRTLGGGHHLITIPKSEWNAVEELTDKLERARAGKLSWRKGEGDPAFAAEVLNSLPPEPPLQLVELPDKQSTWFLKSIIPSMFNQSVRHNQLREAGIPQRGQPGFGLLKRVAPTLVMWPDRAVPLSCENGVIYPHFDAVGKLFMKRAPMSCVYDRENKFISINGNIAPFPRFNGGAHFYFENETDNLYIVQN